MASSVITERAQRVVEWLQQRSADYRSVQGEATLESLQRFRWFLLPLVLLHLAFAWQFGHYQAPVGQPELLEWARSIASVHEVMLCIVGVLGVLIEWSVRQHKPGHALAYALQLAIASAYLIVGAVLTLADLKVGAGAGVTTYLLTSIVIAVMSLLRPGVSIPLFGLVFLFFNDGLMRLGLDSAHLTSVRLLTLSAPLLSSVASITIWHQFVKATLLQRQLSVRNEELLYLAHHDVLTGLYNRRHLTQEAESELARAARAHLPTSMVIVDIDFFKKINDRYGHPAGDEVLQQVANLLMVGVRVTDVVARLGGEEFVVLMPNTARSGAQALAEKLRVSLEQQALHIRQHRVPVTLSAGVSVLAAGQAGTFEALYAAADKALYAAKINGRNRVECGEIRPYALADDQGEVQ